MVSGNTTHHIVVARHTEIAAPPTGSVGLPEVIHCRTASEPHKETLDDKVEISAAQIAVAWVTEGVLETAAALVTAAVLAIEVVLVIEVVLGTAAVLVIAVVWVIAVEWVIAVVQAIAVVLVIAVACRTVVVQELAIALQTAAVDLLAVVVIVSVTAALVVVQVALEIAAVVSAVVLAAGTERVHVQAVAVVHRAWGHAVVAVLAAAAHAAAAALVVAVAVVAAAVVAVVAVVADDGSSEGRRRIMKNKMFSKLVAVLSTVAFVVLPSPGVLRTSAQTATSISNQKTFATPQEAVDALVSAAEKYDETALSEILGPSSWDIIHTGEAARDKEVAMEFAAKARNKSNVSQQPAKNPRRAFLSIGEEDWPFPVPIVKTGSKWAFDVPAGRQEILYRRIGSNELNAIQICRGYVEAQHEYASTKHEGSSVNQYAQKIISTPGKQDGLAWQNADGTWGGPIGENVAKAVERGYETKQTPYHGYYFKILTGQGAAAPLGQLDFVVKGVMIGGFALIAAPAQYRLTGVKTFMVSHDGVVYEKDLGPNTLEIAKTIDRFNPDKSWTPVLDDDQ
jgi:hypothetical protein